MPRLSRRLCFGHCAPTTFIPRPKSSMFEGAFQFFRSLLVDVCDCLIFKFSTSSVADIHTYSPLQDLSAEERHPSLREPVCRSLLEMLIQRGAYPVSMIEMYISSLFISFLRGRQTVTGLVFVFCAARHHVLGRGAPGT